MRIFKLLLCTLAMVVSFPGIAKQSVDSIRLWQSPDALRIVFDMPEEPDFKYFQLDNPRRLVVDIYDPPGGKKLPSVTVEETWVNKVRSSYHAGKNKIRVVFDIDRAVEVNHFTLKPFEQYGDRLVFDLLDTNKSKENLARNLPKTDKLIIAIDAGHGGEDPGALGPKGIREKDANLAIAKALAKLVNAQPGLKAKLVRSGDYFIPLRRRLEIARELRADMLVSIHADGFKHPSAKGASVWVLSNQGADSEMGKWLEDTEKHSDLIGGVGNVSLADKDKMLAGVLLDLSMTHALDSSKQIAEAVAKKLGQVTHMHKKKVQSAGFLVLKSPDVPSILVEAAFITNPKEARLLKSPHHHKKLASAILEGITGYFVEKNQLAKVEPVDPYHLSPTSYTVQHGDTLSEISKRFNIRMNSLLAYNNLRNRQIQAGQVIRIPDTSKQ